MIVILASLFIQISTATPIGCQLHPVAGNVCCVLPNGQQCCSPSADVNGRPIGCNC